jgi:iron complex transport system permease protein
VIAPLTQRRLVTTLGALALGLATVAIASLAVGDVSLSLERAWVDAESIDARILFDHRLPRVLLGLLAGAVLGAAGAVLQGLLRNALADPFVLGVSGGAALGAAAVGLTGLVAFVAEPVGGFIGALLALAFVTRLASREGRLSPLRMLLVGIVFNSFAGALMMVLQALGDADAVQRVLLRLMGSCSVDPSRPLLLPLVAAASIAGLAFTMTRLRALDLLAFGDDTARSLGVDPERLRRQLFVALSLAIGAVVAATGLIGFVGLIVPHALRRLVGADHRLLVGASALAGAMLVVAADATVRVLAGPLGTELPVGVLTTGLGGPLFLVLMARAGRGGRS